MTLHDVSSQLYSLSVSGFFNRTQYSKSQFMNVMNKWMEGKDSIIMEIALPDGWWYFQVSNYGTGYDYYIPDTKEQNKALWNKLIERYKSNRAEA